LILGCSHNTKKEKTKEKVTSERVSNKTEQVTIDKPKLTESQSNKETSNKINLDKILKDKYNNYLASYEKGNLSLCSYQLFDMTDKIKYSAFKKTTEKYTPNDKEETVNVYRSDSSFVKTYFNRDVTPNRLDVVCGRILYNELFETSKVQIGMKKSDFLELFFQPSEIFTKIESVSIYEDEMGEAFTTYRFNKNILVEIDFDSSYDWIDKK